LELANESLLEEIVLFNRTISASRLRDITVSVSDDAGAIVYSSALLNPENVLGSPAQIAVSLPAGTTGSSITVARTSDPDLSGGAGNVDEADVLSLSEVQIFGCAF